MSSPECRFCKTTLKDVIIDLGMSPLANSYLPLSHIHHMEPFYPLCLYLCHKCHLVQVEEVQSPAHIFTDYAYFSSYSQTWLEHSKKYAEMAIDRFKLTSASQVVELASNDGYLLQYFKEKGIPVLGVEPAANVAVKALNKGIPTEVKFFGVQTAIELCEDNKQADLLIGNNVLAHVPDINDFVAGMKRALKPKGVITMEFPHLYQLMTHNQFDTIYHEHFSYFSLHAVSGIFLHHGLEIFDCEELPTHGGSLRIYATHKELKKQMSQRLLDLNKKEETAGMKNKEYYFSFKEKVHKTKRSALDFLIKAKNQGKKIAGFGAPAKGNTFLNFCGIRSDFIDFTVDDTPAKQGRFLPGTHIPIKAAHALKEEKPDYVVILPWNFKDEIAKKHSYIKDWGAKFVVFIPETKILE
ncbi:MAG: class I SAM-dependent methyltransferase [Oligoflexia bacterium]|nr:class I SAM-dependent methyltransferase [Oligoflexia bacterium]